MSSNLSPDEAGAITRLLLEYQSFNHKRQLLNDLVAMGVTSETFHAWESLGRRHVLCVPDPLKVDVHNMLSHIEKGIETREDALRTMSPRTIAKLAKKASDACRTEIEGSEAARPTRPRE